MLALSLLWEFLSQNQVQTNGSFRFVYLQQTFVNYGATQRLQIQNSSNAFITQHVLYFFLGGEGDGGNSSFPH